MFTFPHFKIHCPALVITTALFLCLSACGHKLDSNVQTGNRQGILHVANGDDPRSLDPQLATGISESNILNALFEGLVSVHPDTQALVPALAESWSVSDDKLHYHFQLRKDARWSNGDPLLASDFVYSWKRILSPDTAAEFANILFCIKNAKAFNTGELQDFEAVGVKALSEHELQITLEAPTPFFLQLLDHFSFYPVHPATIEKFSNGNPQLSKWTLPENSVSNGVFKLKAWRVDQKIEVEKNPYYWDRENVHLNGIVFYSIADKLVEEHAFRTEQVHLTYTPTLAIEKIATYQNTHPEFFQNTPVYASQFFRINTSRAPLDDARVRRALALAIDRQALVEKVLKGGQTSAYSLIPPLAQGYSPNKLFEFNPEKARALLSEAGYLRGKDFPELEILTLNTRASQNLAIAIQDMWRRYLDIDIKVHPQEFKSLLSSRAAKNFDILSSTWFADYLDPSNFFDLFTATSGNNHTSWHNPLYDEQLVLAAKANSSQERFLHFENANQILAEEMPIIPLYYPSNINLVQTSVKNWHQNPIARVHYKYVQLSE